MTVGRRGHGDVDGVRHRSRKGYQNFVSGEKKDHLLSVARASPSSSILHGQVEQGDRVGFECVAQLPVPCLEFQPRYFNVRHVALYFKMRMRCMDWIALWVRRNVIEA